MNQVQAHFRIVIPAFIGGATPGDRPELRVPSIKGALRFWWRALAWSAHGGDLEHIKQKEEERFGSTRTGQSPLLLKVEPPAPGATDVLKKESTLRANGGAVGPGARYLGYGLMKTQAGQLKRPCITAPFDFRLRLVSREPIPADILEALKLMGLLGGLGSRWRKGYGSLTLTHMEGDCSSWVAPSDTQSFITEISRLLQRSVSVREEPPFSAFSPHTVIDKLVDGDEALAVLNTYGEQMQRYRSWGKNGKVNGKPSEENFPEDHAWSKGERQDDFHPKRVVFGLPHNYGASRDKQVTGEKHDRRASPLIFHVHDCDDGRYIGIATLLRSKFLPNQEHIQAGNRKVKAQPDYGVITEFIGPRNSDSPHPYFPDRSHIWPKEDQ